MTLSELREAVAVAVDAIRANLFRSLLTSAGIAIGVLFVSLMGWFLSGLDTALERTITLIGPDMLYVDKWDWSGRTRWTEVHSRKNITYAQARALAEGLSSAELAVPLVRAWGLRIAYRNTITTDVPVVGTLSDYGRTPAGAVERGRFFSPTEDRTGARVAVLGYAVAQQLFPTENPLGKTLRIAGHSFQVIGVIEKRGTTFIQSVDKQVLIPLPTFLHLFGSTNRSFSVAVKAGSEERMEQVRDEIRGLMRRIRTLPPEAPDDFAINETQAFREEIAGLRQAVWGVGLGMSMLSFLVGIVGIINIMFVSVVERTAEIGIRKAVGARRSSIALQFLLEAGFLCSAGALVSVLLGTLLAFGIAHSFPEAEFLTPYIPPQQIGIALLAAFAAGVLAGWAPAQRAARLDPITALRYE